MPKTTKNSPRQAAGRSAAEVEADMLDSAHQAAAGMYRTGLIDVQTMRRFDEECLTPVRPFTAAEIRALRRREKASQPLFAKHLNVTKGLVSQWERGERRPSGPALKLLAIADKRGLSAIA
jgi:putative transcriptional regulator